MKNDFTPEQLEDMLEAEVYRPWYLVTIMLDQLYHLTTGERIQVDGIEYQPGKIVGMRQSAEGFSFNVANDDWLHTMAVQRGDYRFNPVTIARAPRLDQLYADQDGTPYADQDGVLYIAEPGVLGFHLMSGAIMSASPTNPNQAWISIEAGRSNNKYPRQRIVPPFANFTRPEGTLLPVNQGYYRIATRSRNA